jgi:hypothetical protein
MVGSTIAQPWYRIPRIELSGIPFWHRPAVLAAIGMLISRTLKFGRLRNHLHDRRHSLYLALIVGPLLLELC